MADKYRRLIRQASQTLGLSVSDVQINKWIEYLFLLKKWNNTYNMTSIRAIDDMLVKHLFDSLAVAPFIVGKNIADVGTGGGLPGVPLAILMPQKTFTLIDSVGKKIRFLSHVKTTLQLDNIGPLHTRVETFKPEKCFDQIISRAFSATPKFYAFCHHLISDKGTLLAMKGADMEEEEGLKTLPLKSEVHQLNVPALTAKRHVIILHKDSTSA